MTQNLDLPFGPGQEVPQVEVIRFDMEKWREASEAAEANRSTEFDVELDPTDVEAWSTGLNALVDEAWEKRGQLIDNPEITAGPDSLKFMTAERGTSPQTEEFGIYRDNRDGSVTATRRFSENDPGKPLWTIDADLLERIDSETGLVVAKHSHTDVMSPVGESPIEQEHTRTTLDVDEVNRVLADIMTTLGEKLDFVE